MRKRKKEKRIFLLLFTSGVGGSGSRSGSVAESDCVIANGLALPFDAVDVDEDTVESARAERPVGSDDLRFGGLRKKKKKKKKLKKKKKKKSAQSLVRCWSVLRSR
jgi:hypothetical protein